MGYSSHPGQAHIWVMNDDEDEDENERREKRVAASDIAKIIHS